MKLLCRIRDLQHDITAFEAAFERRNGINLNEGMALCTLAGRGCLPSGQLADALGLSPSNTSKVLRSLEGKGLVACSSGSRDRRQICYTPTGAGLRLMQSIGCRTDDLPPLLREVLDR
ncbi:MarR family transcriptional regulator [uncultured Alistipes sp.]|uniref:MarR family transcriptional regulator n=1 Tax=uncultured Alistipes sp. TaxID=538949 RepID=UPI00260B0F8F|nr:MarR family transcriptional regulator [uncultured Alistipes sp.]